MKLQNGDTILTGVAEVSVKEMVALEKSVTDKDQTIGALREQIKTLEEKIKEGKDAQKVLVVKKKSQYGNLTYSYTNPTSEEIVGTRNLDSVIEDLRKEEIKKIGVDIDKLEKNINELTLAKQRAVNDLEFKTKELNEQLKQERKEKESEIQNAKEKIRKHMTTLIDGLNNEIDDLQEELKKVKKDKTDEAVEEARKQEIITLKERITELENQKELKPEFGWFKTIIYNWLNVDGKAKVKAEQEHLEKKERIEKISNNYPKTKKYWFPEWLFSDDDPWNW